MIGVRPSSSRSGDFETTGVWESCSRYTYGRRWRNSPFSPSRHKTWAGQVQLFKSRAAQVTHVNKHLLIVTQTVRGTLDWTFPPSFHRSRALAFHKIRQRMWSPLLVCHKFGLPVLYFSYYVFQATPDLLPAIIITKAVFRLFLKHQTSKTIIFKCFIFSSLKYVQF